MNARHSGRVLFLGALLVSLTALAPPPTRADGLYVGHGLRSEDLRLGWTSRVVISGGLQAAPDPGDDFSDFEDFYDDWIYGGYGRAGLELAVADRMGLEFFGLYQKVEDRDTFFTLDGDAGRYRFDNESYGGGITFRRYIGNRGRFSWWGFGTGLLHGEAEYVEMVNGVIEPLLEEDSTAAEVHFLLGWEGEITSGLSAGLELGYRETFLDGLTDFDGFFIGLRLGVRVSGPHGDSEGSR